MTSLFDNEEEDFDFSPSTSTNLSSLFGTTTSPRLDDSSSSLKYHPPKQPTNKVKTGNDSVDASTKANMGEKQQSSVIFAKVITLWKVDINKQTTNIGKHILAIIGSSNQNLFEALIYKEKNDILIRRTLNENTACYQYDNNFVSFYDNQNQFRSVSFENDQDLNAFLSEIIKSKGTVVNKTNNVIKKTQETAREVKNNTEHKQILENNVDLENANSSSTVSKSKADILSRITKMGQQILPENPKLMANTSTELSDSDLEEIRYKKPVTIPRKLKKTPQKSVQNDCLHQTQNSQVPFQMIPNNNNDKQVALNTQNPDNYSQNIVYSQPFSDYNQANFLLAQNFELKASLNDINSKLNNVLNSNISNVSNNDETKALKSKIKILNLTMDNLKSDLESSERHCEKLSQELNEKCEDLRQKELQILNDKAISLKIEEYSKQIENMDEEIKNLKVEITKKDEVVDKQINKIQNLEDVNLESKNKENDLRRQIEKLNFKVTELENDLVDVKTNTSETASLNFDGIEKAVRKNMNGTFLQIMEHFDENCEYEFKDIQSVILKQLKKASFIMLEDIKNCNVGEE